MESIEHITEVLRTAEAQLQRIMAEAANAGDYRTVDAARTVAVSVRDLRSKTGDGPADRGASACSTSPRRTQRPSKRTTRVRKGYPLFKSLHGTLLRIGWSKKKSQEYVQKAPREVVDATVGALSALAARGTGLVSGEEILENVNGSVSPAVPTYKIYVVIGWLRDADCVEQVGREGYRIPDDVSKRADAAWHELSEAQ